MTRSETVSFLKHIEPFSALPPDALSELAAAVSLRSFKANELIFLEQTAGDAGYVLVEGRVALLKTSPSGKELIVELLGPPELFGVLVLLDTQPYPLTARAQIASSALSFGRPLIQSLIKRYPELHHGFTNLLRRRLHSSHNLSRALAHDKAEVRVASILAALSAKDETAAKIEIGRQELADLCGITIETASRVMKGFEKEGAVDLSELGVITLVDNSFLRRIADSGAV